MLHEVPVEYELPANMPYIVRDDLPPTLPLALLHPGLVFRVRRKEQTAARVVYGRTVLLTVDRVHLEQDSMRPMPGYNWGVVLVLSGDS